MININSYSCEDLELSAIPLTCMLCIFSVGNGELFEEIGGHSPRLSVNVIFVLHLRNQGGGEFDDGVEGEGRPGQDPSVSSA